MTKESGAAREKGLILNEISRRLQEYEMLMGEDCRPLQALYHAILEDRHQRPGEVMNQIDDSYRRQVALEVLKELIKEDKSHTVWEAAELSVQLADNLIKALEEKKA